MADEYKGVLNYTGHEIVLEAWDGVQVAVPPTGHTKANSDVANVGRVRVGHIFVPLLQITEREVELPPPMDGRLIVVSGLVASMTDREDVVTLSRHIKMHGRTIGARALARVTR